MDSMNSWSEDDVSSGVRQWYSLLVPLCSLQVASSQAGRSQTVRLSSARVQCPRATVVNQRTAQAGISCVLHSRNGAMKLR